MRKVDRYVTLDGKEHATLQRATTHAENRFHNELSGMAHKLVAVEKYGAMLEFLEHNLDKFADLLALRADIALAEEEDDD